MVVEVDLASLGRSWRVDLVVDGGGKQDARRTRSM